MEINILMADFLLVIFYFLKIISLIIIGNCRTKLRQGLATKWNHLQAFIHLHDLIKLRQIKIDKAGSVGKAIV